MTKQVDLAILVITNNLLENSEVELINNFKNLDLPFIVVHNKCDIQKVAGTIKSEIEEITNAPLVEFSALHPENYLNTFIQRIKDAVPPSLLRKPHLLGDLVKYGDIVLLITPIDIEAPEGRLILPQIQTIRDILDNDCTAIVVKEREVDSFLKKTGIQPALVVTDSQIFLKADASIPRNIPLTSFSILLARQKGDFHAYLRGTPKISDLKNGDRVLLLESCSHHVSCDDIGRVKIPRWITNFTGKKLEYDTVAGLDELPRPMEDYALVIQCGGCMITRRQLINRLQGAKQRNIPVTNYGMAIAYVQGIFNRAVEPFIGESKDQDQLI